MLVNNHDVNVSTFPEIIIEGSKEKPVLVIFWSSQCPVCNELLPLINNIHQKDDQAFVVARINCDEEHQIVSHFGVQSVPSVFMFIDGNASDGFAGEQSKEFIETFIDKHTPDQSQLLLQQGQALFAQGDLIEAKKVMLQAVQLSGHEKENHNDIKLALAQVYLALGEFENAQPLLDTIPMASQNMIYHSLVSQLELAKQSSQTPEITALEIQLVEAIDNKQKQTHLQYQLAVQYNQANRNSEALELLYKILLLDISYHEGEAKQTLLDILATIDDAKLVSEYRRKLYSLLY